MIQLITHTTTSMTTNSAFTNSSISPPAQSKTPRFDATARAKELA
jgi:hypothetical protein